MVIKLLKGISGKKYQYHAYEFYYKFLTTLSNYQVFFITVFFLKLSKMSHTNMICFLKLMYV